MDDLYAAPQGVGEKASQRIKGDILFGVLRPSQRLTLDRLRADYGASVSTLREILNRLVSDGLVEAEGNKGFRVAPVSERELREIADLRLLLERHALVLSLRRGDIDWEGRVVSAHYKLASIERQMVAGEPVDQVAWKRYDWEFHQALISACGSATLLHAHGAIFDRYLRYQMLAMRFRGEHAAREHLALMDAAKARDETRACAVLETHIAGGVSVALESALFS